MARFFWTKKDRSSSWPPRKEKDMPSRPQRTHLDLVEDIWDLSIELLGLSKDGVLLVHHDVSGAGHVLLVETIEVLHDMRSLILRLWLVSLAHGILSRNSYNTFTMIFSPLAGLKRAAAQRMSPSWPEASCQASSVLSVVENAQQHPHWP